MIKSLLLDETGKQINTQLEGIEIAIKNKGLVQRKTLPDITEELITLDPLYQYIGNDDASKDLFYGNFYHIQKIIEEELITYEWKKVEIGSVSFQKEIIPSPSKDELNNIYQYIGNTNSSYICSHFYKCVERKTYANTSYYIWIDLNTYLKTCSNVNIVKDYLVEVSCPHEDMDYDFANHYYNYKLYNSGENNINGSCSAIRKEDLVGRNFDWYYNNKLEFIVKTNTTENSFRSVGVSACIDINKGELETKINSEEAKLIPFQVVDGINECGVYISTNLVPKDKGITKQVVEGKKELCQVMIPRIVLDKATSAENAVELIKSYNIFALPGMEAHYLIADHQNTYVIEFINNETIVTNKNYITNFHIDGVIFNEDGTVNYNSVEPHGQGLERYDYIAKNYSSIQTQTDMQGLLNALKFTYAYTSENKFERKTEFTGKWGEKDLTITSSDSDFEPIIDECRNEYNNRDRETAKTWQTTHSVIYNIETKSMQIVIQERDWNYVNSFNNLNDESAILIVDKDTDIHTLDISNITRIYKLD